MPVNTHQSSAVITLHKSENFYTLLINGNTGTLLSPQVCSDAAFLFVHRGGVQLDLEEEMHPLSMGNYFTIPAHKVFRLTGNPDFEALLTLPSGAELKFIR